MYEIKQWFKAYRCKSDMTLFKWKITWKLKGKQVGKDEWRRWRWWGRSRIRGGSSRRWRGWSPRRWRGGSEEAEVEYEEVQEENEDDEITCYVWIQS